VSALIVALVGLSWVVCGVGAFGLTFTSFDRGFPGLACQRYWKTLRFAAIIALAGPVGLATALIMGWPWVWSVQHRCLPGSSYYEQYANHMQQFSTDPLTWYPGPPERTACRRLKKLYRG
jgi:hypothetical protein